VKQSLGTLAIFSIATGAMLGSGFFLLPAASPFPTYSSMESRDTNWLPHARSPASTSRGIAAPVHAVFVLLGSKDDPQQDLRILAAIARRVEDADFLSRWEKAKDADHLSRVLLGLPKGGERAAPTDPDVS
jgi:hypothetical protein